MPFDTALKAIQIQATLGTWFAARFLRMNHVPITNARRLLAFNHWRTY